MPAFIGLPGAREKTEIGRGLFERSEFRSPRRRAKREAGVPDNQRATFLGNFFAAGKKLQNDVILRGKTPKSLLRNVCHSDDCKEEESLLIKGRRFLMFIRNDNYVILNGTK